jgi:uncharacterized protein
MAKKSVLDWIALILVIIGGLNWGLVAINPAYELVSKIGVEIVIRIIYGLVGLAALYTIYFLVKK